AVRLARYGTDCYGYCMVAAGQADVVIEAGLQPYDIVALIPIIEAAGAQLTNWRGGSAARGGHVVATGDRRLHDQILARLAGGSPEPGTKASNAAQNFSRRLSRSIRISCRAPAMKTREPRCSSSAIVSIAEGR